MPPYYACDKSRVSTCTWSSWPPLLGFTSSSRPLRQFLPQYLPPATSPTAPLLSAVPTSPPQNQAPESSSLFGPPHLVKTVKGIPRASRDIAARKMAAILQDIMSLNDVPSWNRLYRFATRCLRTTKRGGHRRSLPHSSTGQFVTKRTQRYHSNANNDNSKTVQVLTVILSQSPIPTSFSHYI